MRVVVLLSNLVAVNRDIKQKSFVISQNFFAAFISLFFLFFYYVQAGQAPTTISFASSPQANKVYINEINVGQSYVELYFQDTVDVNGWTLYYEGQGNNDGSATICSAPSSSSSCEYSAGTYIVIENVSLHNTLQELLLLDNNNLAVHYFRYANNSNQGGGKWQWKTDDPSLSTIYYANGSKNNLCSQPDGVIANTNWQECDPTKGTTNDGESIHHYEISHDGTGSTCADEIITLKACTDSSCSSLSSETTQIDFLIDGVTHSSPTFVGQISISISYFIDNTVVYSLANPSIAGDNAFQCDNGVGTSCSMVFSSAGCPAAPTCSDIFPGDTSFGVNGASTFFSFGNPSVCNDGSCTPAPTFTVPTMPSISPNGSFTNTSLADGVYQHTNWGLAGFSSVNFSGSGTAVIYFNQSITIPEGTNINPSGSPENVLIIVNGSLTISGDTTINANIYVSGAMAVGSIFFGTTTINGAVSVAGSLSVWGEGDFNFNENYINNMDSKGFCEGTAAPLINHFQIIHDGSAITCETETVTIKACTNAFDGTCSLSSDAVTLDVVATGSPAVSNNITFTGSTTTDIAYTSPDTVVLSIANSSISPTSSTVCNDNSVGSCNLAFSDAEFRFLNGTSGTSNADEVIDNQVSGVEFPIRLQARRSNDGVCEGIFTGNVDVNLSQQNITPDNTNPGLNFQVNGASIVKGSTPSSNVTLNFGGDSIATIPSPRYLDAGEIQLHASYSVSGLNLAGSSQTFWVRPNHFEIDAVSCKDEILGCTANSTTTHKAGDNFTLTISAYNSLDAITENYRQSDGQLQLKLTRVLPDIAGSVEGTLTYASGNSMDSSDNLSASFSNRSVTNFYSGTFGVSTFDAAQYDEVGIINLDVQDINYGNQGLTIEATDIDIGRFTPHYFEQTVFNAGTLRSSCNLGATTFAYSGQLDDATLTKGTINYLSNPIIEITAYNQAGGVTKNYYQDSDGSANDFMKMSASDVLILPPSTDNSAQGLDLNLLPISGVISTGELSQNNLDTGHANYNSPLARGTLHYKLSDNDHFYYQRSSNAYVQNFGAQFDLTVTSITDNEANATTLTPITNLAGVDIRFGRMVIENSYGPETENLSQHFRTEYYDGSKFILNTDDQCTTYDVDDMILSNISLVPTAKLGSTGLFVDGETDELVITAPGAGNVGEIGVLYQAPLWLKFDWSNSDGLGNGPFSENPTAVATFGLFRGNDRIISWREVGN